MTIKIRKVLFPTDFSELGQIAMRYARELAEQFGAQLYCLHVVDDAQQCWAALGPEAAPVAAPIEDIQSAAETQMQAFSDEHLVGLNYVPVCQVRVGRPFHEINTYAAEIAADVIVMATHGRTGVMHALLGSTTEKVIRTAPCPVLTVRSGERDFIEPESS